CDIQPHIPVFDNSARRDGTFERDAFTYDHDDDSYICPGGKRLRPRNRNFATDRGDVGQDGFIRYRARQQDCGGCALRERCTPNMPARKVTRSIHEGARDLARDIATTNAYVTSRR
ncbi:transposase, partial [Escherichia coli]|nr:transposase [Escherichia coli]